MKINKIVKIKQPLYYKNKPMSWREIKQKISSKNKEELIQIINNLYKSSKQSEKYLDTVFGGLDESKLYWEYCEKIRLIFFPKRWLGYNLSKARNVFNEYSKLPVSDESKWKLALCFAENWIRFTKEFGDIDEPFYNSIESIYEKWLSLLKKADCLKQHKQYAYDLMNSTCDFWWGFYDTLSDTYDEYYNN